MVRRFLLGVGLLCAAIGLTLPASAQGDVAHLRLIHAAPDVSAVDVFMDGQRIVSDLAYSSLSGYLDVPAGTHKLAVSPAGQDASAAVITAEPVMEAGKAYSVAAIGLASAGAQIYSDDLSAPAAGTARVRVIHTSPDAPGANVEVVDGPILIRNLAFPDASTYLEVPGGTYNLRVVAVGENSAFIQFPNTALAPGTIYDVVATGRIANIQVAVGTFVPSEGQKSATGSAATQPGGAQTMPTTGAADVQFMLILAGLVMFLSGLLVRRRTVGV